MGSSTAKSYLNTVYFSNGKHFGLSGVNTDILLLIITNNIQEQYVVKLRIGILLISIKVH